MWVTANGRRLNADQFVLLLELPQGVSMSMGRFRLDTTKTPAEIDLGITDGIGRYGDRFRDSPALGDEIDKRPRLSTRLMHGGIDPARVLRKNRPNTDEFPQPARS
jgi:hypothetical protein